MITVTAAGETVTVGAYQAYLGPTTVTTPGTVIDGKVIDSLLKIQAADVVVRNCLVRGAAASSITGLIDCRPAACRNFLVEDCTFDPRLPSAWLNGAVMGHDFTARRCDVSGTVDGFGVYNTFGPRANVLIEGCYIHDLTYYAPDYATNNRAETHNDGIQVQSGLGVVIRGNLISAFMSETKGQQTYDQRARGNGVLIQTNIPASPATDYLVKDNQFHGGGNAGQLVLRSGPGEVRGNVFDTSGYNFGGSPPSRYQIRLDAALVPAIKGLGDNRFVDGTLLTLGRNTGIRVDN